MMERRIAYYIQYWSPKTKPESSESYYWGGVHHSLKEALDAANMLEERKPEAFGIDIYSRKEHWIADEEYLGAGYWEAIDETITVYDRRGAVIESGTEVPHHPVKGEQAGMLGVPGKYVEQKRPWTPGQMGFESYGKYIEAMDRKYSLAELRELCRQRGLSASGDKKTLVRRLF